MKNKRLNTVTFDGQTYTAPAGYVFLNIGDNLKKGDSVFSLTKSTTIENINLHKYTEYAYKGNKQCVLMLPSIRKIRVRKVGPAIPKIPPVPKIYNIELSSNQVKILSILLNNNQGPLNNWFNQSSNYHIEKSPELIEAADNEFKKAGLNENCIWNKLYQIIKDNIQDFPKK